MVYDEGFEVVVDGWTYFAFNKYVPKKHTSLNSEDVKDYVSVCDKTMVGWFHDREKKRFGCYRGYQTARLRFRQANEETETQTETETDSEADSDESEEEVVEQKSKRIPFNPNHVVSPFAFEENAANAVHPAGTSGDLNPEPTMFYELETITEENKHFSRQHTSREVGPFSDDLFVPDMQFIETQNRDHRGTWKAGLHQEFLGKRMSEMMKLLSHRRFTKLDHSNHGSGSGSGDVGPHRGDHSNPHTRNTVQQAAYRKQLSSMPKEFSWIKYDSPVRNQGECGSCYSLAAMTVYEVRLRIKTQMKDKTIMSGQDVLSCSRTNQGCEGGYPFLVGKHAAEYGLVPEACVPYKASDIDCDSVQFTSSSCANRRYFARNYRYVGGYYGSCNELLMMKEIMRNGPVIVAFQAPSSLFYYNGGIFTGPPPKHEGKTENGVRYWEQTNHAVVAMGWGEENGHKYWIIKNTWGPRWGEKGYFRIQRGTDECGLESMATTFDVVV
jgi:cathepsin C